MTPATSTATLAAFLLIAAYSTPDQDPAELPAKPKSCFNFNEVTAFKTLDADTIRIETRSSGKFDVDLSGPKCGSLDKAADLSIKSAPSYRLCAGNVGHARLGFATSNGDKALTCSISKMDPVSAEPPEAK